VVSIRPAKIMRDYSTIGLSIVFQPLQQLLRGPAVDDVVLCQPGAAGGGNSIEQHVEIGFGVRVGVDTDGDTKFFSAADVHVIQIEPRWMGVDLQGDACLRGGVKTSSLLRLARQVRTSGL